MNLLLVRRCLGGLLAALSLALAVGGIRGDTKQVDTPHAASVSVSPLVLDFGPVGLGTTSATQLVTIRNTGSVTLTNFAGGAPADGQFSASQNCAAGVAPGATCQYFVTFSPTAVRAVTTNSNTSTNAGPFSIELRGTGVGAGVSVSPLSLDFGYVAVGATSPNQVVTIRNTGLATLTFAGGAPADAQFGASQNCAAGVAPGATCQYTFNFKPTATGTFTSSSNSSTNAGPFVIQLRGTGVTGTPPPGARLSVSPLVLDFGPVGVGTTSASQVVTIRNSGSSTLTNFVGGGPPDTQFSGSQNCAAGVAPGATCQYTFTFRPISAGSFTTTSESSTNAGPFTIELRGTGVGAGVTASPLSLDFGPVTVGTTSANQAVTIRNTGLATLTFSGGGVSDPQFGGFQNCAAGVAPGASCQFTYNFHPNSAGAFSTTSNISTNAGPIVVRLRGGVGPPTPSSVVSRQTHGSLGPFDINFPLPTTKITECRRSASGANYRLLLTFPTAVAVGGVSITSSDGLATANASVNGFVVTVNLAGVAEAQTLGLTLMNVNNGSASGDVYFPFRVLVGDSNGDGAVNSGDATQVRSRAGQATNATNFRSDLNVDTAVNSGDAFIARARSGQSLP